MARQAANNFESERTMTTAQLYLQGRLLSNPEISETKKGRLMVRLLLATQLVRETRPGEYQTESVTLPVLFFSQPAEQVKTLKARDTLTVGAHLYGTKFESADGSVKHGVQIIADTVFFNGTTPPPVNGC
jgi:single-stranded DNA-binding protein